MAKKQDQLIDLLEEYKSSDMSPEDMAGVLRGLVKLQPSMLELVSEPPIKKGRRKNATNEVERAETSTSTY